MAETANQGWTNKVPEVTVIFWMVKVLSTTVGETGADYLAVHVGMGAGPTTVLMAVLLAGSLTLQLREDHLVQWKYWLTVVLLSVVGTQLTDILTDTLGVSLYWSTLAFGLGLIATFAVWHAREKTLSIKSIVTLPREFFYWTAILMTFALGTAAGDLATEELGLGFTLGAGVFGALIGCCAVAYWLGANPILTFWFAYVLTRPFGASLGDLLSQAQSYGGAGLGTIYTSLAFLTVIVLLVSYCTVRATNHSCKLPNANRLSEKVWY